MHEFDPLPRIAAVSTVPPINGASSGHVLGFSTV
jgi:hypothetical protein